MKRAFSVIPNLNQESVKLLKENNIELTINKSDQVPDMAELIMLLQAYDIIIIGVRTEIPKEILDYIDTPKIIATLSIGLDHIDKEVQESSLVNVVNIEDANTVSVAEHIFALVLSLSKRICESNYLALQKKGHKKNLHERPDDISGKKLGLIGAGNITREVIKIAKVFNLQMSCYTRNPDQHENLLQYGVKFVSLEEVLRESDIINVSLPLTAETKHFISKDKVELMKSTAIFINTSRAEIADTEALIEKADEYGTFYVGLDIDLDRYEDLLSKYRNNVIVTPHTAGVSKQAIYRMDLELAHNIIEALLHPSRTTQRMAKPNPRN